MSRDRDRTSRTDELLGRLPREIAPARNLWPAIEGAIRTAERDCADDARLMTLPQAVAPPAELWPRIAADIARDGARGPASRARSKPLIGLAASVALAAIVGAALFRAERFGGFDGSDLQSGSLTDTQLIASESAEAQPLPGFLDPESAAPAAMSAAFEDTRRTFHDQITAVRMEREAIEASLALYPDQPTLLAVWRHTYEAELRLIDEASRVLTHIQTGWRS